MTQIKCFYKDTYTGYKYMRETLIIKTWLKEVQFSRPNLEWGQSGASDQLTGGTCKLERRVRGWRPWLTFRQMGGSWNWYLSGNQRRGAKAGVSQEMSDNLFGLTRCLADLILWKNWGAKEDHLWLEVQKAGAADTPRNTSGLMSSHRRRQLHSWCSVLICSWIYSSFT